MDSPNKRSGRREIGKLGNNKETARVVRKISV
jgi:hypothetical protein